MCSCMQHQLFYEPAATAINSFFSHTLLNVTLCVHLLYFLLRPSIRGDAPHFILSISSLQAPQWCSDLRIPGSQFTGHLHRPWTTHLQSSPPPLWCQPLMYRNIYFDAHSSGTVWAETVLWMTELHLHKPLLCLSATNTHWRPPHDACSGPVKWVHAKESSCIHWFQRSISLSNSSPPLSALLFPSQCHGDM